MILLFTLVSSWFTIAIGALTAAVGLPIAPWPIAGVSCALAAGAVAVLTPRPVSWSATATAGAAVAALVGAYVTYLAWPSLYPIAAGPDLVHHLTLIHFIQARQALPDDALFGPYLGEMTGYPPGSHLIAAMVGSLTGRQGVQVIHVVMAAATAIKAGLILRILTRVLPAGPSRMPLSVAGALLLLTPHAYLLSPVTHYGFYSQVVSEVFTLAMWWALIVWQQTAARRWLALASMFGIGIVLTWPVFLPAPALTAIALVLARTEDTPRRRITNLLLALGPAALVTGAFTLARTSSAGILASGGSVLTPAIGLFGWPFLVLVAAGAAATIRHARGHLPITAFTAVCLLQVAGLIVLQHQLDATNYYLGFKTVHLLVYALVTLAALGLASAWRALTTMAPASRQTAVDRAAWLVPVLVLAAALRSDLPQSPLPSPITGPVHRAGQWARANLPANCVDYLVPEWLTAYWLHIDVLGNARASARVDADPYDFRRALGPWVSTGSMRYAIVEDWNRIPADARDHMRVRASFDTASVVERSDEGGSCTDERPPIDAIGR